MSVVLAKRSSRKPYYSVGQAVEQEALLVSSIPIVISNLMSASGQRLEAPMLWNLDLIAADSMIHDKSHPASILSPIDDKNY
ncbi:hypothetical protein J6590_047962 [Homalodisca vitripennis]|nr:hypothetical protein J6590_047962 [Homalodisca vitripennis]